MTPTWKAVHHFLDLNWNEEGGYTAPNPDVYPWRWLWDSCFHVLLWSRLRPERALQELEAVFRPQDGATGFIPHVHYVGDPGFDRTLWGRESVSTITQPPMYGHAIRMMSDDGLDVPERLVAAARLGIDFFIRRRRHQGLIVALHPWETGCDDSPRWDSWVHSPYSRHGFALVKGRLVGALQLDGGVAVGSDLFRVGSVALTALVAFNALELVRVTGDVELAAAAATLIEGLQAHWDEGRGIWVDGGPDPRPSGGASTLEAFLPLLVDDSHWDRIRMIILDPARFDSPHGPRQVDARREDYRSDGYWRGATWPQLNYLLWVAARRHGDVEWAARLAETTLAGAITSGWSEYWDAETGTGHGASPQSWTGLAALMADGR